MHIAYLLELERAFDGDRIEVSAPYEEEILGLRIFPCDLRNVLRPFQDLPDQLRYFPDVFDKLDAVLPGQPARITFARAEHPIPGHVLRLGRKVDEETREFEVDIALDALPANWALGQRATARIMVKQRGPVLTVPTAFLVWREGRPGVWVVTHARARWREVTLGETGAERVEIRHGLEADQEILRPVDLYPFMRVRLAGRPT